MGHELQRQLAVSASSGNDHAPERTGRQMKEGFNQWVPLIGDESIFFPNAGFGIALLATIGAIMRSLTRAVRARPRQNLRPRPEACCCRVASGLCHHHQHPRLDEKLSRPCQSFRR
ncbi:hypothetical protein EMPG_14855, partial [Blastomyces silverae]